MSGVHPGLLPPEHVRLRLPGEDGGELAAVAVGPVGPAHGTVLLVPGYTGSKEDFALVLAPLAAAGFRAVAVDQRGQHESSRWPEPDHYTVARLAADLVTVARQLDPAGVHLVGHSFGGLVARAAVLAEPAAFRSLVLMGSGPAALGGPRAAMLDYLVPLVASTPMPAAVEQLAALERQLDPAGVARRPAEVTEFLRQRLLATCPLGLCGMAAGLVGEPDRVAELRATGVPTLVLHGAADNAWTPAEQADMAARLGAGYVVIPGAAHSPAAERPAATAAELVLFLSGR